MKLPAVYCDCCGKPCTESYLDVVLNVYGTSHFGLAPYQIKSIFGVGVDKPYQLCADCSLSLVSTFKRMKYETENAKEKAAE